MERMRGHSGGEEKKFWKSVIDFEKNYKDQIYFQTLFLNRELVSFLMEKKVYSILKKPKLIAFAKYLTFLMLIYFDTDSKAFFKL